MDLLSIVVGMVIGAAAVIASNFRAAEARKCERSAAQKHIEHIGVEKRAIQNAFDSLRAEMNQLRIDQANNAGYIDGYAARTAEMEVCKAENEALRSQVQMENVMDSSLRTGKRIVYGSFSR